MILVLVYFKEVLVILDLIGVMKDDLRLVLCGMVVWVFGKIGGDGVGEVIEKVMECEKDEEVFYEMNCGFELLV